MILIDSFHLIYGYFIFLKIEKEKAEVAAIKITKALTQICLLACWSEKIFVRLLLTENLLVLKLDIQLIDEYATIIDIMKGKIDRKLIFYQILYLLSLLSEKLIMKNFKNARKKGGRRDQEQKGSFRGRTKNNDNSKRPNKQSFKKKQINRKPVQKVVPQGPQLTHGQQRKLKKKQIKQDLTMGKLLVQEQLKKSNPNFQKITQYLGKIKSRGLKQRIKKQVERRRRQAENENQQ